MQGGNALDDTTSPFPFFVPQQGQLDPEEEELQAASDNDSPEDPVDLDLGAPSAEADWEPGEASEHVSSARRSWPHSGHSSWVRLGDVIQLDPAERQLGYDGCSVPPREAAPYEGGHSGGVGPSIATVQVLPAPC